MPAACGRSSWPRASRRGRLPRPWPIWPVGQVIAQTTRRVLQGEQVPATEKLVSLFEPHTAIIRKGKPGKPTEFGRVLWLDEVDGGIISRYTILEGNPAEDAQLPPSRTIISASSRVLPAYSLGIAGHSTANERYATTHGVKEVVLPKPGAKSAKRIAHERSAGSDGDGIGGQALKDDQRLETPPQAGPVPVSWHRRDGTLGWAGACSPTIYG